MGVFKAALFGGRTKYPRIDQAREDVVQIIHKKMPGGNGAAYLIKAKFVINVLQEEIAAVETVGFYKNLFKGLE